VSANRLFIQDTVFDEFVQKLEVAMKTLTLGDGAESGINTGPLINNAQAKKASRLIFLLEKRIFNFFDSTHRLVS